MKLPIFMYFCKAYFLFMFKIFITDTQDADLKVSRKFSDEIF